MDAGGESAPAADEGLGIVCIGKPDHLDARLHPHRAGPTAEEAVVGTVGDAVDLPVRAARRLLGDETVPATVAGLVDIEKGDHVTFLERGAFDVGDWPAHFGDSPDRDMSRNQGIGDATQPAMVKVNVGSAD